MTTPTPGPDRNLAAITDEEIAALDPEVRAALTEQYERENAELRETLAAFAAVHAREAQERAQPQPHPHALASEGAYVLSELRSAARALDALDAADVVTIMSRRFRPEFDDDGNVTNAGTALAEFKRARPDLFVKPVQTRDRILAMSPAEFKVAEKEFFDSQAREERERLTAIQMRQFTGTPAPPPPPPGSALGMSPKDYERSKREFEGRERREHQEALRAASKRDLDALNQQARQLDMKL